MGSDDLINVPSGQTVSFHEFVRGAQGNGLTYRFRFIAPHLGAIPTDPVQSEGDMAFLCANFAMPRVANIGPRPNRIVISLSEQETEFGMANPETTQIFESYSLDGDLCVWEPF